MINKNKDGRFYPAILTISPIFNASHDISNFVCIQSDPSKHEDICSDILAINADGAQLHQVLMHLINNTRDALEAVDEPCISIGLESFHADAAFIESHPYFKDDLYAHLSVEDNGCGIPEDQIKHLFEPFFTTKEQGKGSTFHIYLPLLEAEYIAPEPVQKQASAEGHGELILLADDEQMVRGTMAEVLESMGYRVLQARDGLEAIEIFKTHQDEIALALLDVIMPKLGGIQLAGQIRAVSPELPVIFLTGYDKEYVLD